MIGRTGVVLLRVLFSGRLPRTTQSMVSPLHVFCSCGLIEQRSGYRAPGAVRGSRLINPRSTSTRCIAGITRVEIDTGESGSPPGVPGVPVADGVTHAAGRGG